MKDYNGLTQTEVLDRVEKGLVNYDTTLPKELSSKML